jgi:hypothetical protein
MSDTIFYNYGANYGHLDDIQGAINAASEVRDSVHGAFNALTSVYEGEAASALQTVHQQSSDKMDGHISDMQATHQRAVERQMLTAQQDHQLGQNLLT